MDRQFRNNIYGLVIKIPKGRVMTYGQIAHFGYVGLPWHRVVSYQGCLVRVFTPYGIVSQAELLCLEIFIIINSF